MSDNQNPEARDHSFTLNASFDLEKASLAKANEHKIVTSLRDQHGRLYPVCKTKNTKFGEYGVGLQLYFSFMKALTICFFVMSIISVIPIALNISGGYFSASQKSTVLEETTLGNVQGSGSVLVTINNKEYLDSRSVKLIYVYTDIGYSFAFFLFLLIFYFVTKKEVAKINQDSITPADYAIYVKGFPHKCSIKEEDMKDLFEKNFGRVVECKFARKYGGAIDAFNRLGAVNYQYKKEETVLQMRGTTVSTRLTILKLLKERAQKNAQKKMPLVEKMEDLPPLRAFVVFDRVEDKEECLRKYNKLNSFFTCSYPKHYKLQGVYKLSVEHSPEPSIIKWENFEIGGINKFFRSLFVAIIVILCLALSFTAIYSIKIYQSTLPSTYTCDASTETQYTGSSSLPSGLSGDSLSCYCMAQGWSLMLQDATLRSFCTTYITNTIKLWTIKVTASVAILIVNIIIGFVFRLLGKFHRYTNLTKEVVSIMTKLFIAFAINTGVFIVLINANFRNSPGVIWFNDHFPLGKYLFNGDFSDIDRDWFTKVGADILLIMIINVFSPLVVFMLSSPITSCKRWCLRKKKILQVDLNKLYEGPTFDLGFHYAKTLAFVFVCFAYSGGLPLLLPIITFFLFMQYWMNKYLVLRAYKRPPYYDSNLNERALRILPAALLIHLAFSLWCYGAPDIFTTDSTSTETQIEQSVASYLDFGQDNKYYLRATSETGLPFLVFLCVFVIYGALSYIIIPTLKVFTCRSNNKVAPETMEGQKTYTEEKSYLEKTNIVSYDIRYNVNYKNIIYALEEHSMGKSPVGFNNTYNINSISE